MELTERDGAVKERELIAACALSCVPGVGASTLSRVAQALGSVEQALDAGCDALVANAEQLQLAPRTRRFLRQRPDLWRLGEWALSAANAAGARVVLRSAPDYPDLLRRIDNAPAVLYVRGELAAQARRVAIVGSRAADGEALRVAREIAERLACFGVEIVSGGARGIDAAAHAGALWGGGRTIAVLGCGVDVAYPPEHADLFDGIASSGGAVVSEFPPGAPSSRPNFPRRNRTIAGLSHATVVVRAGLSSGALLTAASALDQQRALFAVPGDPHDAIAVGPNQLIEAGAATAVCNADELLRLLDWSVAARPATRADEGRSSGRPSVPMPLQLPLEPALEGPSRELWRAMQEGRPAHIDDLAARTNVPPHEALRWLTELELKGLCRQAPGKYFLRCRAWPLNPNGSAGI
jgi:DNA processing protein